ncbi:MAG: hypothetical protein JW818_15735, partial [Pirellulales bacterium]|nr:hypothetical protein [Pirellulales bacterium]
MNRPRRGHPRDADTPVSSALSPVANHWWLAPSNIASGSVTRFLQSGSSWLLIVFQTVADSLFRDEVLRAAWVVFEL